MTDSKEKANSFNFYYSTVIISEGNIPHIQGENTGEPFTIGIKIIRRRIRAIGKNKSIGPDRVSEEILKLAGETMIPHLAVRFTRARVKDTLNYSLMDTLIPEASSCTAHT